MSLLSEWCQTWAKEESQRKFYYFISNLFPNVEKNYELYKFLSFFSTRVFFTSNYGRSQQLCHTAQENTTSGGGVNTLNLQFIY